MNARFARATAAAMRNGGGVILLCLLTAATATAQQADHLRCRRVEGAVASSAIADLRSALGVDAGCKIRGAAREICEAAYDEDGARLAAASQTPLSASVERLCYRVRCPRRETVEIQVADRFGERALSVRTPSRICVASPE